jgi:hypothetical protein
LDGRLLLLFVPQDILLREYLLQLLHATLIEVDVLLDIDFIAVHDGF